MASLTDYTEQKLNDWLTGKADMPATTTRYLALFTAAPSDAGGGTEVSGGSYARVAITDDMETASGTDGTVTNTGDILLPTATGPWGTVTHFAVMDAASGGNMIEWDALDSGVGIASGQTFRFASGALEQVVD